MPVNFQIADRPDNGLEQEHDPFADEELPVASDVRAAVDGAQPAANEYFCWHCAYLLGTLGEFRGMQLSDRAEKIFARIMEASGQMTPQALAMNLNAAWTTHVRTPAEEAGGTMIAKFGMNADRFLECIHHHTPHHHRACLLMETEATMRDMMSKCRQHIEKETENGVELNSAAVTAFVAAFKALTTRPKESFRCSRIK